MFVTGTEPAWLAELNPEQQRAATYGEGPLLVVAGAGSGKTRTLACRVAYLLEQGVPPERLLLLTFTRRAARELLVRAEQLTGKNAPGRVWGGTFHSVGNRLLRMHGRLVGLPETFTVMDQGDAADLIDLVRLELGLGKQPRRFPRKDTLAAIYSRMVNAGTGLQGILEKQFPWCADEAEGIRSIFAGYVARKREQDVLDYDDLLLFWKAMLSVPSVRGRIGDLFDHVLVDEYQDTNALQADILLSMRKDRNSITVVGDDAQSIYSFRAATIANILDFPTQHPGTEIITLERNYRSTRPILESSNAVIAQATRRHSKELWSERESAQKPTLTTCLDESHQSHEVCRRILEHRELGTPLKEQAVLFRAGHHSTMLEFELTRRNIPFVKYGGLRFVEAAHVKDVVAFLRILENPHDELAWFRVLQLMRGVGPAAARRIMDTIGVRRTSGPDGAPSPLVNLLSGEAEVAPVAASEYGGLLDALRDCEGAATAPAPAVQIDRIRRWVEPLFVRKYDGVAARLRDLEQLAQIAGGYGERGRFVTDLTLDPPNSSGDLAGPPLLDEDYLVLSTIHSAKGGEWDVVHVLHVADGMIPSDMSTGDADDVDEERRLFYVALTRARDDLHLYFPLRYYHRPMGLDDAHSYAQLTRFLPSDIKHLFEERAAHSEVPEDAVVPGSGDAIGAVSRMLEELWST